MSRNPRSHGVSRRTRQAAVVGASPRPFGDDGFSLVELMIALLVLSILLAIAVPTFLGTTTVANNRSAQANLNTALTDAKAQYQSSGQTFYVNSLQDSAGFASLLTAAQLSMTFKAGSTGATVATGSSGSATSVSVAVSADGNGLVLAAYSLPGNCYYLIENTGGLSPAAKAVAPYAGTTALTTSSVAAPAGTIGLPTATGESFAVVRGDTTAAHCNAYSPKTSGSPATVQYLTTGFPL
jgi:prepilin-type N-terminal cleavage/methylation domain-containing protein